MEKQNEHMRTMNEQMIKEAEEVVAIRKKQVMSGVPGAEARLAEAEKELAQLIERREFFVKNP